MVNDEQMPIRCNNERLLIIAVMNNSNKDLLIWGTTRSFQVFQNDEIYLVSDKQKKKKKT